MTVVRRVTPADAAAVRRVRLRALETDPASFGSHYAREAAYGPEVWEDRATKGSAGDDSSTLLAFSGDAPVGIVSAFRDEDEPEVFAIVAMWVAPEARRAGLGRGLLRAVEEWIAAAGGSEIRLSVTNEAAAARRLYESAGYEPDGRIAASRHTEGLVEIGLTKRLA